MPPACRFEPRCPYAWDLCREKAPDLYPAGRAGQTARCHLHTPAGAARLPEAIEDHDRKMNVGHAGSPDVEDPTRPMDPSRRRARAAAPACPPPAEAIAGPVVVEGGAP